MTNLKDIKCPICQKENTWEPTNVSRPFCSERCKLIDLGDWASEKHKVSGESVDPEQLNPPKTDD
jgi:endogenous inhibitor of DNA gyrase (YacG/DUF329 family)